eukprot:scaffold76183_cov23-Tisochrysis_lutea.AAC.1
MTLTYWVTDDGALATTSNIILLAMLCHSLIGLQMTRHWQLNVEGAIYVIHSGKEQIRLVDIMKRTA